MKTWTKLLCATAVSLNMVACSKDKDHSASIVDAVEAQVPVTPESLITKPKMEIIKSEDVETNLYSVTLSLPSDDGSVMEDYEVVLSGDEGAHLTTQIMQKNGELDGRTWAKALGSEMETVIVTRYEPDTEGYQSQQSYEGVSYIFVKNENSEMVLVGQLSVDKEYRVRSIIEEIKLIAAENELSLSEATLLMFQLEESSLQEEGPEQELVETAK